MVDLNNMLVKGNLKKNSKLCNFHIGMRWNEKQFVSNGHIFKVIKGECFLRKGNCIFWIFLTPSRCKKARRRKIFYFTLQKLYASLWSFIVQHTLHYCVSPMQCRLSKSISIFRKYLESFRSPSLLWKILKSKIICWKVDGCKNREK